MSSILDKMAGMHKLFFFRPFIHSYFFMCKILSTFHNPFFGYYLSKVQSVQYGYIY